MPNTEVTRTQALAIRKEKVVLPYNNLLPISVIQIWRGRINYSSSMLVATKLTRTLLVWHYFYNPGGEQISDSDHTLEHTDEIVISRLGISRHVVG